MPRKETLETRMDPTPGKMPVSGGERGGSRPAGPQTNQAMVAEAAERDADDSMPDEMMIEEEE